jgi:hypothetical protein
MASEKIVGKITDVVDETETIKAEINIPTAIQGIRYVKIEFTFDDNGIEHKGLVQLMFENNSYRNLANKIPKTGSPITIIRKWFIKTIYKVDIEGLNRNVNFTKIS